MYRQLPIMIALIVTAALMAGALAAPPHLAAAGAVTIVDFEYQPGVLAINSGETVTWTNSGTSAHTTTSDDGLWDSGALTNTQTFSFTFPSGGLFEYHCTIHPAMGGSIFVSGPTATPTRTPTATDASTSTATSTSTPTSTPSITPKRGAFLPIAQRPLPSPTPTNTPIPTDTPRPINPPRTIV